MENNLNNEENSNNSNADNNLNQPTDNVDNNNDNNITKFKTISDFFLDSFGIVSIVSGLIYIYLYIVAYSKSLYYSIPIKYFYSNNEMVKPIIYIVCIFLIILPYLKNLKYKIIEENLTVIRILSILASFIILSELCAYTIGNPADISERTAASLLNAIKFLGAIIIVLLYAKRYYDTLKNESEKVKDAYIAPPLILILFSILVSLSNEILSFQFIPIISMSILVVFSCLSKRREPIMKDRLLKFSEKISKKKHISHENIYEIIASVLFTLKVILFIFIFLLLIFLNTIMNVIAYRSDYEVIKISTEKTAEENTEKTAKESTTVIITEYNDSFIVMSGTITDSELSIDNNNFNFVDKNDINGYISYLNFKKVYIKYK